MFSAFSLIDDRSKYYELFRLLTVMVMSVMFTFEAPMIDSSSGEAGQPPALRKGAAYQFWISVKFSDD